MNQCNLSEMIELWKTQEISADELHQYLLGHISSPAISKVLILMHDFLSESITPKEFFDQAFKVAKLSDTRIPRDSTALMPSLK